MAWVVPTGILLTLSTLAQQQYPLSGYKWESSKQRQAFKHREKEKVFLE